jgi:hypothetical protein
MIEASLPSRHGLPRIAARSKFLGIKRSDRARIDPTILSIGSVSHVVLVTVRSIIIRKMTVVLSLVKIDIQEERTSIDRCLGGRKHLLRFS